MDCDVPGFLSFLTNRIYFVSEQSRACQGDYTISFREGPSSRREGSIQIV